MMNYLNVVYEERDINKLSVLALAYIGDSVFEICSRLSVFNSGNFHSLDMHKATVSLVNAKTQSAFSERLLNEFTEKEKEYFRRGRNAKVNSVPKGASVKQYHEATGLETVFGYLYLSGQIDRINYLFSILINED